MLSCCRPKNAQTAASARFKAVMRVRSVASLSVKQESGRDERHATVKERLTGNRPGARRTLRIYAKPAVARSGPVTCKSLVVLADCQSKEEQEEAMRVRSQSFLVALFLLAIPVTNAQQIAPERIIESIEREGCVRLESGKVNGCKYA
jgi:hypothetical protein